MDVESDFGYGNFYFVVFINIGVIVYFFVEFVINYLLSLIKICILLKLYILFKQINYIKFNYIDVFLDFVYIYIQIYFCKYCNDYFFVKFIFLGV